MFKGFEIYWSKYNARKGFYVSPRYITSKITVIFWKKWTNAIFDI